MPLSKGIIGRRIANARKASRMTQAELSKNPKISEPNRMWEAITKHSDCCKNM